MTIQTCISQNNDLLALLNKAQASLDQAINGTLKVQGLLNGISAGTSTDPTGDVKTCIAQNSNTMALMKVIDPYVIQSGTDTGELSVSLAAL